MNNTQDLLEGIILLSELATIDKEGIVTFDPTTRYESKKFVIFVRLGSTDVINDNAYCGMLRHRIIIDIYSPTTEIKGIKRVFSNKADIEKGFSTWGRLIDRASNVGSAVSKTVSIEDIADKIYEETQKIDAERKDAMDKGENFEERDPWDGIVDPRAGGVIYELASSYLENTGTYTLPGPIGTGLEMSFSVDESVGNAK